MNKVTIAVIAVVVVIILGAALYVLSLINAKPPSPELMLGKWAEATYTANYTMTYRGNINIFNILGVSVSVIGPEVTWSQGTLNKVLIQLYLSNSTQVIVATNNLGGGVYNLCFALASGLTLSYCQHVTQSQVPLLSVISSQSWVYRSRLTINGLTSYCYMSITNSSAQTYNVTLCIAPNGVLTMAHVIKQTPSGYYDITMTISSIRVGEFLANEFNELTRQT